MRLQRLPIWSLLALAGCRAPQTATDVQPPEGMLWLSYTAEDGDGFDLAVPKFWLIRDPAIPVKRVILDQPRFPAPDGAQFSVDFAPIEDQARFQMLKEAVDDLSTRRGSRTFSVGRYLGVALDKHVKPAPKPMDMWISPHEATVALIVGNRILYLNLYGQKELPSDSTQMEAMIRTMRVGPNREPIASEDR